MIFNKNTKVKDCPADENTDILVIVADALQGDILFTICLDYVPRISIDLLKENTITLAKERSRRYLA